MAKRNENINTVSTNILTQSVKRTLLNVLPLLQLSCEHRLLDSLVVHCWLRVREVPDSIPSQGPRHTKDVMKMVPVVPLFSTQH